jgi:N-acetylmuramoyl-L-alanine amidase
MTLISPAVLYGQGVDLHKKFVVAIDAGHGEKKDGRIDGANAIDPTTGKRIQEDDIVLNVALKLKNLLSSNLPDVEIVMTRPTNEFIELSSRSIMANNHRADLFISIHCNKTESNSSAHGLILLVMGPDGKSDGNNIKDDDKDIANEITNRLALIDSNNESWVFAEIRQRHCKTIIPSAWRQNMISTDNLSVLRGTAMPSVLAELGFLSNSEDLRLLQTDAYQNQMAQVLFNAIKEYKNNVQYNAATATIIPAQDNNNNTSGEPNRGIVINPNVTVESGTTNNQTTTPAQPAVTPTQQPTPQTNVQTNTNVNPATTTIVVSNEPRPMFYVQVSSITINKSTTSRDFKSYSGRVEMRYIAGRYKYFVGGVATYEQGLRLLREVKRVFPDAFLVAFLGEKQLSLQEARNL